MFFTSTTPIGGLGFCPQQNPCGPNLTQGPIHGAFGSSFINLGGCDRTVTWLPSRNSFCDNSFGRPFFGATPYSGCSSSTYYPRMYDCHYRSTPMNGIGAVLTGLFFGAVFLASL